MRWVQAIAAVLVLLGGAQVARGEERTERLRLGSLVPECTLEKTWTGRVPEPWALQLVCGGVSFTVVHPRNLTGKVHIQSSEQALEYVRFFSSPDTYDMFELDGMVEVVQGEETATSDFNVLDPAVFRERLRSPSAERLDDMGDRGFVVNRTVVAVDQKVYAITEYVRADGYYQLLNREVLVEDALSLGIIHVGRL